MPKLRHIQSYESLKPDSAFATAWIQALMLDSKENLWVSSLYTGVYKLKIDASGVKKATLYSTKNGLSINDVSQIVEGKDKSVWFATRNGADRLYTDKKGNEKIIHYNNKNGFGSLVYQILPDDSVTYISFQEGVYVINNSLNNSEDNRPLSVLISNVSVMGKPDTTALMSGDKPYALPYNRNYISFEYGVVRLKDSEGIDYQYKLDGIDKEWSEYSTRRYASYNSLPPGKYTFRVRAKTINNDESGAVTSYSFRINPPFYRTWWFFILLLAVFTSIGYVIYNQRIMQLIKIQKLRNKIASDLHDDVGSTLSSISIMSDLLQSQLDNSSRSEQMIRTIGANAHTMLDSMDDIIWSVNPANDKFQNLALRVREYAIPLFEMKNIRFSIDAPEEMNALQMPMDVRRNLYLIAKEAVNNLVKYSHASQADISFGYAYNALTMSVKDNGQGFDLENAKRNRNGLVNMRQRAEQIHGTLTINSEIGKGTCVTLQVKII
jgi:two-component sensor histidine kinase